MNAGHGKSMALWMGRTRWSIKSTILALLYVAHRALSGLISLLTMCRVGLARIRWQLSFVPRLSDIYIVTYPRSGTTWLQMILYQLTTDGNMEFRHIGEVIPTLEHSISAGRDLNGLPSPRIFKTHCRYRSVARWPGKYIYVVRDGRDVLVSYFHLHRTHFRFGKSFATFFDKFMRGEVEYGSWFQHVYAWRAHAGDPNVLLLNYEDLATDLDNCVRRIAEFCGLDVPPDRFERVRERCSFAFMKAHESKFDLIEGWLVEGQFTRGMFLRQGAAGSWKGQLTREQEERFEQAARNWFK